MVARGRGKERGSAQSIVRQRCSGMTRIRLNPWNVDPKVERKLWRRMLMMCQHSDELPLMMSLAELCVSSRKTALKRVRDRYDQLYANKLNEMDKFLERNR